MGKKKKDWENEKHSPTNTFVLMQIDLVSEIPNYEVFYLVSLSQWICDNLLQL